MAYNTIKLKKYLDIIEEYEADAEIIPGMLLELNSDNEVLAHNSAGVNALPMFALEDELQGKGIDDVYDAGDQVQVWITVRGEQVYAILADGENVAIGDFLESNGNGYLRKYVQEAESWESGSKQEAGEVTVNPLQIVAVALEALDLSESSGESSPSGEFLGYNRRIKVRIV